MRGGATANNWQWRRYSSLFKCRLGNEWQKNKRGGQVAVVGGARNYREFSLTFPSSMKSYRISFAGSTKEWHFCRIR
jgi:hypothetical protein